MAESSVELCLTVMWKAECFNYDLELRRFPSRVESATLLLFAAYKLRGKTGKQTNKQKKETRLDDLENSKFIPILKDTQINKVHHQENVLSRKG